MAGLCAPLPTLRRHPRGCQRTARGRCGLLLLHRSELASPILCRFLPAHQGSKFLAKSSALTGRDLVSWRQPRRQRSKALRQHQSILLRKALSAYRSNRRRSNREPQGCSTLYSESGKQQGVKKFKKGEKKEGRDRRKKKNIYV